MAYDEVTTIRFRNALGIMEGLSEKRMMGGICFLLHGNMIGGADQSKDGAGRFMFRIGKDNQDKGNAMPLAQPMEMGGRLMSGLFFVDAGDCDDELLRRWIALALSFGKDLPHK
ncbi:MAG: TfoX/Sxy family protein [Parasphingorhabdus sp.]